MNILFCLIPKNDVDIIFDDASLFKALQIMEKRNYYELPLVSKADGSYIGTISAGDILGCIKENFNLSIKDSAEFPVRNVKRIREYKPVKGNANIEDIIEIILSQNFVPVVDDDNTFIGIVTRGDVIKYMHKKYLNEHPGVHENAINKNN